MYRHFISKFSSVSWWNSLSTWKLLFALFFFCIFLFFLEKLNGAKSLFGTMRMDFPSIIFDVLLLKNLLAWKMYAVLNTVSFGNSIFFFSSSIVHSCVLFVASLSHSISISIAFFLSPSLCVLQTILRSSNGCFGYYCSAGWLGDSNISIYQHFYSRNSLYFQLSSINVFSAYNADCFNLLCIYIYKYYLPSSVN